MIHRITKFALMGTASAVAALVALPSGAAAQTACAPGTATATNNVITCVNGTTTVATGTSDLTTTVAPGSAGQGLSLTSTGNQTSVLTITGPYTTSLNAAVRAQSGGSINFTSTGAVSTSGAGALGNGYSFQPTTGLTANVGAITTSGASAFGVLSEFGTDVSITTGPITTTGGSFALGVAVFDNTGNTSVTTGALNTTGQGVFVDNASTGTTTVNTGAITITGDGYEGVSVRTGGPVSVTTAAITTTGANSEGVVVTTPGAVTATTGNISTTGAGSTGLLVSGGAGAVTATVAGATTAGANADAISITSAGPVSVTNSGTIAVSGANSVGIDVATTGTGAVNVTTGVVNSTATNAAADPSFAAVRVVAAGAAPVAVTANGNITAAAGSGIWAQTAGTSTVTVNSGVTVSAPTAVTLGGATGNVLVVNGTLNSTAAGTSGYVLAPGAGPLTLSIGTAGVLGGPLTFSAGADTFTNAGTYTQTSTIDFLGGADIFNNSGTFNHGGIVQFGAGADTLNNSGTLNLSSAAAFDFGADADVFNNTGTLNLRNGAQSLAGLEVFNNNAGLIDLRDGAANDVLTIPGNYAATGNARLGVDIGTTAAGALTADRLVYTGTTTGVTTILPTFLTGSAVIDTTGALVVDAGTVAAGQFVLGGTTTNAGLINYGLETRGSDVFLTARPDEVTGDLLFVNRIGNDIWYQSAEAYQAYAMSRRVDFGNDRKSPIGIWAQLYNSKERFGDRNRSLNAFNTALTTSNRFETKRRGAQTGLEFGAPSFLVGVTAGYEHAEGGTDFGTTIDAEGYNYGAYAQFGMQQGLYAGVLLKRDVYDVRILNSGIGAAGVIPEGKSTGIDGEVGFRFGNPGGLNFDVGAGLSYVRSRIDDYTFGNLTFDNDRNTSTRGRLQARASFAGAIAPFIDGKLFREFGDAADLTVRSGTLSSTLVDAKRGTWGRLEAGIGGGAGGGPLLSAFVDLGDVRGWGLRGGFRF